MNQDTNTTSPLIEATELAEIFQHPNLVIIDATATADAKAKYAQKHIQGALFMDQDTQMADIKPDVAVGGRHPLPSPESFAKTLGEFGISPDSHVIVYDEKNASAAASRLWWMLIAAGHTKVQVLNGGLMAAQEANLPITDVVPVPKSLPPYPFTQWNLPIADMSETEIASTSENYMIVDVRDAFRYLGEMEPIDLIAGHIPGAVNIPYSENLDSNGKYLPKNVLRQKYEPLLEKYKANHLIVHCGSGVTACHTLLAMAYAGMPIPKLYVGSWSEWSRNNKPMVLKH